MLTNSYLHHFVSELPREANVDYNDLLAIETALEKSTTKTDPLLIAAYAKLLPAYLEATNDLGKLEERFNYCPPALASKIWDRYWQELQTITNPYHLIKMYRQTAPALCPLIQAHFTTVLQSVTDAGRLVDLYLSASDELEPPIIGRFEELVPIFLARFETGDNFQKWFKGLPADLAALVVIAIQALPPE